MAHLKHSGPIRQAANAKRTALVEIYSDEPAANDEPEPDFARIEAEANADARAIVRGAFAADDRRALERQVDAQRRDPVLGGLY